MMHLLRKKKNDLKYLGVRTEVKPCPITKS